MAGFGRELNSHYGGRNIEKLAVRDYPQLRQAYRDLTGGEELTGAVSADYRVAAAEFRFGSGAVQSCEDFLLYLGGSVSEEGSDWARAVSACPEWLPGAVDGVLNFLIDWGLA